MEIAVSFLPVLLFLTILFILDHFNLVNIKILLFCVVWGMLGALAWSLVYPSITSWLRLETNAMSRYIAPIMEELIKAFLVVLLISRRKIGLLIDSAIYGFAIGTGFSLLENLLTLTILQADTSLSLIIIRGFGTAFMHGGCTSLFAIVILTAIIRTGKTSWGLPAGLLAAIFVHSAYNFLPAFPVLQTSVIMISLPVLFLIIFRFSHAKLQQFLEIEFSSEIEMLVMIRLGKFRATKAGKYLESLKDWFAPDTVVDMYCYLKLYLELSIKAKRNIMLREKGYPVIRESELESKLNELCQLKKRLGTIGEIALAPLIRMNYRKLWELNQPILSDDLQKN